MYDPGPWRRGQRDDNRDVVETHDGKVIALVVDADRNGALLAAAPDLLSALNEACGYIKDTRDQIESFGKAVELPPPDVEPAALERLMRRAEGLPG
jgi:hypothetical protein